MSKKVSSGNTFQHEGATYTVRPLIAAQAQQVTNIFIDLLKQVAKSSDFDVELSPGVQHRLKEDGIDLNMVDKYAYASSYPYVLQVAAQNYVAYNMTTDIEGRVSHPHPTDTLSLLNANTFRTWLKYTDAHPTLLEKWDAAYIAANHLGEDEESQKKDTSSESE